MSLPACLQTCALRPAATDEQLAAAESALGRCLPADYRQILRVSDGLEGFVAPDAYLSLWASGDLAPLNDSYAVDKFLPGVVLLGTDGGDTGYGFTNANGVRYVAVPLVGTGPDALVEMGDTLEEFLARLGRPPSP